ncbi:MAG: SDR family oxidoreductase, partial [Candidatus Bathyarchaeota archaeon]|nr:SDR family oxidoreductase [Candidatus Bathyarchaeota archaeon]
MNVLVTGGAGYIGSVMSRILLEKGYSVTCLDRLFFGTDSIKDIADKITLVKDDIRFFNPEILKGVDAVFDLAALSNDPSGELEPQKTLEINHNGRVRVARLAKKYGVKKYVLASTCSVYGFQEGIITEESGLNPLTTYAKANMMAEKEVLPLADKTFSATVLRQATVYGFSYRMRFDLAINGMVLG